jgi:hypothetical protein
MKVFMLLVTWFTPGQPTTSYQVTFSSAETCDAARLQVIRDAERLKQETKNRYSGFPAEEGALFAAGSTPSVSAVCSSALGSHKSSIFDKNLRQVPMISFVPSAAKNTRRWGTEKPTPADEILVARVGALRLITSDAEAAALRGEQIDLPRYIAASEALEAAIRTDHRMLDLGSPAAEEEARAKMREVLMTIAPEIVEQSDREDEAAERAQAELESEPEPAPEPADEAPAPALPSNVVRYHSTRRGPNGEHPAHYLKRSDHDTFEVPYFPLDPRR